MPKKLRRREYELLGGFVKLVIGPTAYVEKTLYVGCGLNRHDCDKSYIMVSVGLIWVFVTLMVRIWRDADA